MIGGGSIGGVHDNESTRSMHEMRYYARLGGLLAVLAGASLAACGSSTNSANDTLPPIASTTTTTVVQSTTTTLPATYTIKSGDSLFTIAQMFGQIGRAHV